MHKLRNLNIRYYEADSYYRTMIGKRIESICRGSNFPQLHFCIFEHNDVRDALPTVQYKDDIIILGFKNRQYTHQTLLWEQMKQIREGAPEAKIIVISDIDDVRVTSTLYKLGVDVHIEKDNQAMNRLYAELMKTVEGKSELDGLHKNITRVA